MKNVPKNALVNTLKKDNRRRKVKKITHTFELAVLEIDAPRTKTGAIDYHLVEIFPLQKHSTALAAVLCGATSYHEIETFGKEQLQWQPHFYLIFLTKTTSVAPIAP